MSTQFLNVCDGAGVCEIDWDYLSNEKNLGWLFGIGNYTTQI